MRTVTVAQAQQQLPSLLAALGEGEAFVITDGGRRVGQLLPLTDEGVQRRLSGQAFLDRLDEIARGNRLQGLSILDLRDEGRRQ